MKKNGFTLAELLAVITVIAIISLIAGTLVLNAIDNARRDAFKDTAYGLIDAARVHRLELIKDGKKGEERAFTIQFNGNLDDIRDVLSFQGKAPDGGTLKVDKAGDIELAIWSDNNKVCVVKSKNKNSVEIDTTKTKSTCKL